MESPPTPRGAKLVGATGNLNFARIVYATVSLPGTVPEPLSPLLIRGKGGKVGWNHPQPLEGQSFLGFYIPDIPITLHNRGLFKVFNRIVCGQILNH